MSVYIIAEAGINHSGEYHTAVDLAYKAKECGADAVKFQTYVTDDICDKDNPEYTWLKKCEMPYSDFELIKLICDGIGIDFISTPDTVKDAEYLDTLGMKYMKIGSANATKAFLGSVSHIKTPLIVSLGMGGYQDWGHVKRDFLHCVSAYPVPDDQVNLKRLRAGLSSNNYHVSGLSDHTIGSVAAIMAVAMGAKIIEKHFTLDCTQEGPDHHMSADPDMFRTYVADIRRAERMLGDGKDGPMPCEEKTIAQLKARRKS